MKFLQTIIYLMFSTCLFFSCNNNGSAKGSASTSSSSGTSGSGDDYYYESTVNSTGKEMSINELVKMYVSAKGSIRTESLVTNSMAGKKVSSPIVLLAKADRPGESIMLDDSAKTYTVNHLDSSGEESDGMKITSSATKVGNETIIGFNCVHAQIISHKSMGSFYNTVDTINLWKSNEVPMESSVKTRMEKMEFGKNNSMFSQETAQQLKEMGCTGMTVKMTSNSKKNKMTIQLTKVERKDLPANLFEIPAGYKEEKD